MAVSGQLSHFSLPEVLQFAEEGHRTGLLAVQSSPRATESLQNHFIWLRQGRIIAAANCNDYFGLSRLITHRQWIPQTKLFRLIQQCPMSTSLGAYLKSQGWLTAKQLKILFSEQIIREICSLFELSDGYFHLISNVRPPYLEMIGMSVPATEVTLPGLRSLRDWSVLNDKLPNLTSGLLRITHEQPQVRLTRQELSVWKFADGSTSLNEIAQRLDLSIDTTQRISFRLFVAGLAEEVPLVDLIPATEGSQHNPEPQNAPSPEFLHQMLSFFEQQANA